jgi:hypothetical protein
MREYWLALRGGLGGLLLALFFAVLALILEAK